MFYYDLANSFTSNGSAGTATDHLRLLTASQQESASIAKMVGGARFGTAGGMQMRAQLYATASTSGSAQTPDPRNKNSPAANTTAFTAPTAGSTPTLKTSVGLAQTGGEGGEVKLVNEEAIQLKPNGGASGNLDFLSNANAASVTFDFTVVIGEGG